jgi:aspartate/methionine/tyrosine aminotransferase
LVRLRPPDWRLDPVELAAAFSTRTKLVLLNSPMNPSGKVFSRSELSMIAEHVVARDAYAVCDEVYEHIVFDDHEHLPLMAFPGMAERTVRIGSAGKTFSITGWKVGYVTAGAQTLAPIAKAHQFLCFTTPPNLQRAVAFGLRKADDYFTELRSTMQGKRDRLRTGLESIGFGVAACEGTYFLNADFAPLGFVGTDEQFCRHITEHAGVAAVPFSAFYPEPIESTFVRFCFCKSDQMLDDAVDRLRAHLA